MPRGIVIVNMAAGCGGHQVAGRHAADALGLELRLAEQGTDLTELARLAVAEGAELVVAGGGDGTVAAVAAGLVDTAAVLGVLPLGTLNHFARDLGLPLEPADAVRVLAAAEVARVDVGEVNGRVFLNNASLGLYADTVAARLWHQRRGWRKWPAMALAALGVLRRFPLLEVTLDGVLLRTPFVFVGNNRYEIVGPELGRRRRLDAGHLGVLTTQVASRSGLLRALLPGWHRQAVLDEACTPAACIETRRRRLRVATDGEVAWLAPPLVFRARPGALQVLAPAERSGVLG